MWLDGCFHIGQRRPHDTIYSVQARQRRQVFEAIIAYSRPSEESKARLFKALNKKSSVRQKKDEL